LVCSDDAMHQHRECSPAGCDTENRCPWDQRCAGQEPTPTPAGPTPTPIPLVTNVMISNNSNFSDAQTKSWPFSASSWTIPWTLIKGDGPKIVYAKFQWSDGTETSKVSDDIVLNSKLEPTPTPTPSGSCEDTDGGKEDYGTKGCVTDFGDTRCDSCIDKNTLLELYCEQAPGQDRPCRAGSQVSCPGGTVCEDGACVVPGAPTPTPTVTPVPTPGAKPRAGMGMTPTSGASDKLIVMCHPWQLTYALVGVQAWGHCSEPSETFLFAFTIDYFQGTYYSGPLVAQGAGQHATGVGYWSFFMNDINQMFHFPQRCCRGYAGDIAESFEYTLSAHGACAARNPVTGKLERTSDWSPSVSSSFTVYKKDKYGHVTCDPTEAGDIEVAKPEILDLSHTITGDGGHEGYANVNVTYNTDIESDCKTYLYKWTGMGYDEVHHSGLTTGKSHSYSTSRFYNVEDTGYYRYQAVCAKEGYYSLPDDEDHSDVRTYEEGFFTLPQGGGSPNASRVPLDASDVDLNENEDVDIGDWGALVDDYAKEEEGLPADFNNNGQVDILDVSKFIDAYRRYTN